MRGVQVSSVFWSRRKPGKNKISWWSSLCKSQS